MHRLAGSRSDGLQGGARSWQSPSGNEHWRQSLQRTTLLFQSLIERLSAAYEALPCILLCQGCNKELSESPVL